MAWSTMLERRWFPLVLLLAWAFAYLPSLGARDLRLEEGRRGTPAREMLQSGDWARPTLYGDTYLNKPPLFYWVIAGLSYPGGEVTPLTVRLPSAFAALLCALLAWRFAPDVLDQRTRRLAALLVLSSATLLDKGTLGEIDPLLCALIAGSLKCWWDGRSWRPWSNWLLVGLFQGAAILAKGPAGPMLFYLTIVPFLWRVKQLHTLRHGGHGAALILMILPVSTWILWLTQRDGMPDLITIWIQQLGLDTAANALQRPGEHGQRVWNHYSAFFPQIAGMFFPGLLWLLTGWWRRREFHNLPQPLTTLLICGTLAPTLVVFLYPESRPRHAMASFFAAALLAAVLIVHWPALHNRTQQLLRWSMVFLARGPLLLAVGVWIVYLVAWPFAVGSTLVVSVVCVGLGCVRVHPTAPKTNVPRTIASLLACQVMLVWFVLNCTYFPYQGERAHTRLAQHAVAGRWSAEEWVYTTRTFPAGGEGYYNLQFHLAQHLRALHDFQDLPRQTPCIVILTPDEHATLDTHHFSIELLVRLDSPNGPPPLHVVRVQRK